MVGLGHLHAELGWPEMRGTVSIWWGTTRAPPESMNSEAPSPPTPLHLTHGLALGSLVTFRFHAWDYIKPNLKATKFFPNSDHSKIH